MKIDGLLKQYPKKRPPLSKKLKKIFNGHYLENRQSILSQLSEQWLHRSIKKSKKKNFKNFRGWGWHTESLKVWIHKKYKQKNLK